MIALPLTAATADIHGCSREVAAGGGGQCLVLAMDVLSSMEALDMTLHDKPDNRLDAAKAVVARFVADRPNDRIGSIVFAGAPYLVSPPTLVHEARVLTRRAPPTITSS